MCFFRYLIAGSMLSLQVHSCFCTEDTLPSDSPQPKPEYCEDINMGKLWMTLAETLLIDHVEPFWKYSAVQDFSTFILSLLLQISDLHNGPKVFHTFYCSTTIKSLIYLNPIMAFTFHQTQTNIGGTRNCPNKQVIIYGFGTGLFTEDRKNGIHPE